MRRIDRRVHSRHRRLGLEILEIRRVLATFLVTTAEDVVDENDALTSLREAIAEANTAVGSDTIRFDSDLFAAPTQIDLLLGQLNITDSLTITGPGRHLVKIDAQHDSRIINFVAGTDLTLEGLTLSGGRTTAVDVNAGASGGAIRFSSTGTLVLNDTSVIGNSTLGAGARGGGIFSESGNVVLNRSIVSGNSTAGTSGKGGGIYSGSGSVVLIDSEVSENSTSQRGGRGGGIYSSGSQLSLLRSVLRDNSTLGASADGGGVFTTTGVTIDTSVVSGNTTLGGESDGGAIFANGFLTLLRSDVTGNTTGGRYSAGGAIAADSATVVIEQSSVTGNRTTGQSGYGAGLFLVRSDTTITGSTISGNTGSGADTDGGGVSAFFSSLSVNSSTITQNTATGEGGGLAFNDNGDKTLVIRNSIVAQNRDLGVAPDFLAPINPQSLTVNFSLIGDNTGTSLSEAQSADANNNFVGDPSGVGIIDPLLDPLVLVGNTRVHPLRGGSAAVGAGNNGFVLSIPNDQRGEPFARIANPIVDMGSFERQTLSPDLFVVTTAVDELDFSNAEVSLREAIAAANGTAGSDVITFDPFVFAAPNIVIDLTLGELTINESLAINGPGSNILTVDAGGIGRVMTVTQGNHNVALSGLTLSGGLTTAAGAGGGGIRFDSTGILTLRDSVVTNNHTGGDNASGGGIDSPNGHVVLQRSTVAGNSTLGRGAGGGGIHSGRGLVLTDSTIAGNRTLGEDSLGGGALARRSGEAVIQMTRSTVSGNSTSGSGSHGGGIAAGGGSVSILNSTLSGNASAGEGGGVFAIDAPGSNHLIASSTIAQNSSGGAGGGASLGTDISGSLALENSIVATNHASAGAPDLDLSHLTGNLILESTLIGDNTGTSIAEAQSADSLGNLIGAPAPGGGVIDPLLGPLILRGGLTATHSLRVGSPAIDSGNASLLGQLDTDQRGTLFTRVSGRGPDMGAFESQTLARSFFTVNTPADELDFSNADLSLREALVFSSGSAGVDTIRFDAAVFSQPMSIDLLMGELRIVESVNIAGPGRDLLTIDAQNNSRVFNIAASTDAADVTLSGMTVTGGRTVGDNQVVGSATETTHSGGGIRFDAAGSLTLNDVSVTDNNTLGAGAAGGGIFAQQGALTLINSNVENNSTIGDSARGGGVSVRDTTVSIIDSSVQDNSTSGDSAGGGGVSSSGATVLIRRSTVSGNRTTGSNSAGGGIDSRGGDLTLESTSVSGNFTAAAGSAGGGLFFRDAALNMTATSIESNSTSGDASPGGGIAVVFSSVTIAQSAILHNSTSGSGSSGAGISADLSGLRVTNATLSGNHAMGVNTSGGAMEIGPGGDVTIINTTVTDNSARAGGGIWANVAASETVSIANSIVAANQDTGSAPDLRPPVNLNSLTVMSSLIGDNTGTTLAESQTPDASGNLIGSAGGGGIIDPMLAPLANNGGTTQTHAPLGGSPIINAGDNALAVDSQSNPLVSDQRAAPFLRFFGSVDMGAFEVQPPRPPIINWANPDNIFVGTELSNVQLNASTDTAGSFVYTPSQGTILPLGNAQTLSVDFTPFDTVNYTSTSASVQINVVEQSDLGDAPDSYATLRLSNGPRHLVGPLFLGSSLDAEVDGQPTLDADGDGDDDDGVSFITTLVADPFSNTTATIIVNASARGALDAWIDFDRDGVFDQTAEHLGGGTSITLFKGDNILPITIPDTAIPGETYARFRISSAGGLDPTGNAADGEVEDYAVTLVDGAATPTVDLILPQGPISLFMQFGDLVVQRRSTDLFRAPSRDVGRLEIVGNEFSNVLTIDNSGGAVIPNGGLSYDGVDRVNTVRLLGPNHSLDLSRGGNVALRNIEVIDMSDPADSTLRIDSRAARAMDPTGGGVIVVGSDGDQIVFVDGRQWRMAPPITVAGFSFSVVTLNDTFVQLDFASAWQNLAQPSDVNNDGRVTAGDALRVINELGRRAFSDPNTSELDDPATVSPWPNVYFDQNGDRFATALDALRIINELARQSNGSGSGEAESMQAFAPPHDSNLQQNSTAQFTARDLAARDLAAHMESPQRPVAVSFSDAASSMLPSPPIKLTVGRPRDQAIEVDLAMADAIFIGELEIRYLEQLS